jgi:hypothetical protein
MPSGRAIVEAVVAAAKRLGDVRVVMWGPTHSAEAVEDVKSSGLSYVILRTPKLRSVLGKTTTPGAIAEAIDAADDLAGDVRLELDLRREEDRARLKLERPGAGN